MNRFLAAAALVGMTGAAWSAPPVPNGSFEDYDVGSGASELLFTLQGPPYPFDGYWSANGTNSTIVDAGAGVLPAGNGSQYVSFNSSTDEIYQIVTGFVIGRAYRVSYWATGATGYWGIEESNTGGTIVGDGTWKQYSFTFTASDKWQHLWFGGTSSVCVRPSHLEGARSGGKDRVHVT
jgi:hypothetical protein